MGFSQVVRGLQSTRDRFRRIRKWKLSIENAIDAGYLSDSGSSSSDPDSLAGHSFMFTDPSYHTGASGAGFGDTDRSVDDLANKGEERRGIGFNTSFGESDKENCQGEYSEGCGGMGEVVCEGGAYCGGDQTLLCR